MTTAEKLFRYSIFVLMQVLAAQSHAEDKPYQIIDGKVDQNTFQGWQAYQDVNCGLCHGDSGQAAPPVNLVKSLQGMSKQQFVEIVIRGKGLMPPFISQPKVTENIDKIYSYLKARSDGALGDGKPQQQ
ncbi:MAG: cytochrome c [Methylococcaceae bacterium]|nr:cytochrome c [Methylococcaceae bacterium]